MEFNESQCLVFSDASIANHELSKKWDNPDNQIGLSWVWLLGNSGKFKIHSLTVQKDLVKNIEIYEMLAILYGVVDLVVSNNIQNKEISVFTDSKSAYYALKSIQDQSGKSTILEKLSLSNPVFELLCELKKIGICIKINETNWFKKNNIIHKIHEITHHGASIGRKTSKSFNKNDIEKIPPYIGNQKNIKNGITPQRHLSTIMILIEKLNRIHGVKIE